jgi:hypothetical protein
MVRFASLASAASLAPLSPESNEAASDASYETLASVDPSRPPPPSRVGIPTVQEA